MKTSPIKNVGQIGIPVKDIQRAMDFYQNKMELTLLFNTDSMAFFDCDGLRLMLTLPEKEAFDHPSSVIYFQVANINDTYKDLESNNVVFLDKPHMVTRMGQTETWMVFFKDTEDNTHALMSEVQVKDF